MLTPRVLVLAWASGDFPFRRLHLKGSPAMGLKAFDRADEVREFPLGRFEIVQIAGVRLGVRVIRPVGSGQFMMLRQWLLVSVARRIPGQFCLDMASSSTRMARARFAPGYGHPYYLHTAR